MDFLLDPHIWASFLTLTLMEIVLGIDNVIFVSIVANRLPPERRAMGRTIGLSGALVMRVALLFALTWLIGLTAVAFEVLGHAVSWRDIILMAGGVFLLVKATLEIHNTVEGEDHGPDGSAGAAVAGFGVVIAQIMALDLVFSVDSILTAIGMVDDVGVMIAAVVVSIGAMMLASKPIADFIQNHPTAKMLALSFLLLIGVALVADALQFHIPRGYLYAAIGFSVAVEALNQVARRNKRRTR
ncbi:Integral membrane protein TerC [alpha proteobacterium BAL199]|jgi:predicted tellurium resistance membrane protein TerC|nr:Integral membrane protein TerC [alpha proteobacterium BAL199]